MDWFRYHVTARWILAASATILAIGLLSCRREELTPVSFRVVLFGKHGVESDVAGLTLGDFDGDGDLDAWASDGSSFRIWRHRGAAEFVPEAPFGSSETFGKIYQESFNRQPTALGDVDADGDLDAVPFSGDLWLNDGQGNFSRSDYNFRRTSSEQTAAQVLESYGEAGGTFAFYYWQAALGDLDGDGDLDVLTLDGLVWLNDGSGEFTLRGPRFEHGDLIQRGGMTLGDLDGDGDLDAFVVGGVQSGTFIWRNDGNGGLTPGDWIAGATSYFGVEASLGDLDGDGDLDVCLKDRIWSNDGEGGFSGGGRIAWIRGDQYSIGSFRRELVGANRIGDGKNRAQIHLGDLNGDGHLDAVLPYTPYPFRAWLNDGNGSFRGVVKRKPEDLNRFRSGSLGDIDGDGDLDVCLIGDHVEIWLNLAK